MSWFSLNSLSKEIQLLLFFKIQSKPFSRLLRDLRSCFVLDNGIFFTLCNLNSVCCHVHSIFIQYWLLVASIYLPVAFWFFFMLILMEEWTHFLVLFLSLQRNLLQIWMFNESSIACLNICWKSLLIGYLAVFPLVAAIYWFFMHLFHGCA